MSQYFLYTFRYYIKAMATDCIENPTVGDRKMLKEKLMHALATLKGLTNEDEDYMVLTAIVSNGDANILIETEKNSNDQVKISSKLLEHLKNALAKEKLEEEQKVIEIELFGFKPMNKRDAKQYVLGINIEQDEKRKLVKQIVIKNNDGDNADTTECVEDEQFNWYNSMQGAIEEMENLPIDSDYIKDTICVVKNMEPLYKRIAASSTWENNNFFNRAIVGSCQTTRTLFAQSLAKIYYHLGFVNAREFIIVNEDEVCEYNLLDHKLFNKVGGIVWFENIECIIGQNMDRSGRQLRNLMRGIEKYSSSFVFFAGMNNTAIAKKFMQNNLIEKFFIDKFSLPQGDIKLTIEYWRKKLEELGIQLNEQANEALNERFNQLYREEEMISISNSAKVVQSSVLESFKLGTPEPVSEKETIYLDRDRVMPNSSMLDYQLKKEKMSNNFSDLKDLIGLDEIKKHVQEMVDYASLQIIAGKFGKSFKNNALHMMFAGNPGTGKTTVAKIVGHMLYDRGVIRKNIFVEASRDDLVGMYVGHTAVKTRKVLESARGGILFIDEAYSLCSSSERDFGNEAVATMVQFMEEFREDLIIIFAGYPNEMEKFIKMNPGLKERIPYYFEFKDYSVQEMLKIFELFAGEEGFELEEGLIEKLHSIIKLHFSKNEKEFSNGRTVRNIYEKLKVIVAQRMLKNGMLEKAQKCDIKELVLIITLEDLEVLKNEIEQKNGKFMFSKPVEKIGFSA